MLSSFTGVSKFGRRRVPAPAPVSTLVLDLDALVYSGSGNWLDQSGNGNDGVITGTPTYVSNFGSYFDFTGGATTGPGTNDSFRVSDSATLDSMTNISFETWIRIDAVQGTGSPNLLFDRRTASTNGYVGFFTNTGYTFRVGTSSPSQFTYASTPTVGVWQHIVVSISNTNVSKMYINNTEVASSTTYAPNFSNIDLTAALTIGDINIAASGVHSFDGEMGLFRIYDTALSSTDVTTRWDATRTRFGL